jgi:hypothetical protein
MKKLRDIDSIKISVIDQIGRCQVNTIEEVIIVDKVDGETLFDFPDASNAV